MLALLLFPSNKFPHLIFWSQGMLFSWPSCLSPSSAIRGLFYWAICFYSLSGAYHCENQLSPENQTRARPCYSSNSNYITWGFERAAACTCYVSCSYILHGNHIWKVMSCQRQGISFSWTEKLHWGPINWCAANQCIDKLCFQLHQGLLLCLHSYLHIANLFSTLKRHFNMMGWGGIICCVWYTGVSLKLKGPPLPTKP